MTNEELVSIVCPIFNDNSYKYYFSPSTIAVGKSLGLKGMEFYVAGRGGALGDCQGTVVAAAFGYFNPIIINAAWTLATAKHPARTLGSAHYECAAVTGREKLSALPNLAEFVAAMEKVFDAMDPDGLTLFAAFKSLPLVDDLPGRAMQLAASLREYRGSAHLLLRWRRYLMQWTLMVSRSSQHSNHSPLLMICQAEPCNLLHRFANTEGVPTSLPFVPVA